MEREKIEIAEHLNIIKVIKNGTVKRFEISADSGYSIFRKDEESFVNGIMYCPAKESIEKVLENIEVRESV